MLFKKRLHCTFNIFIFAVFIFISSINLSCALGDSDALEPLYSTGESTVIAIRSDGDIYLSTDLRNWMFVRGTTISAGKASFGNERFLLAGGSPGNGITFSSEDGIIWNDHGVVPASNIFSSVAYGKGVFVIGGNNGRIYTTTDGNTPVQRADFGGVNIGSFCFGNDKFVGVGGDQSFISSDGSNWQDSTPIPGFVFLGVCYGQGKYIAVGNSGAISLISSSTDGMNWTGNHLSAPANNVRAVTYANRRFVAVGDGGIIYVSENGNNWVFFASNATGQTLYSITYCYPYFIAVGDQTTIVISEDGYYWEEVLNLGGPGFYGVAVQP